jgi:diketogulonate reductase-like aldo/keto reductase
MNTGRRIPLMGLGTYKVSDPAVITRALELGYRHFDCE